MQIFTKFWRYLTKLTFHSKCMFIFFILVIFFTILRLKCLRHVFKGDERSFSALIA